MNSKLASAWAAVSLRAKLTALSVALIGLLLAISSAGTVALLRTYLQQSTDTLLTATAATLRNENPTELAERVAAGRLSLPSLPSDYYIAILTAEGDQVLGLVSATGGPASVPNFANFTIETVLATEGLPFEVDLRLENGATASWRIVAQPLNRGAGSVVVALPTNINRQILSEYGAIGGRFGLVLLAISGLSIWLTIASALRPLREVERTAADIKAGDFSKRLIEDAPAKTEIGRLNRALNAMLDSIEKAFKGREKTLDQMRRFVSDASHELRTPLVTVRGYAELYRMGAIKKPEQVAEAMARIESEAIRMSGLVEQLLALTRLDELSQLDKTPTDLNELVENACADARIANPNLRFRVDGNAISNIDPDKLRQVFVNLLANAARFAPSGSEVLIELQKAPNGNTRISVIDHGEGIPDELKKRVFDRFYRVDNSRNRESGGSGLGLAIVRSIIDAHDAQIKVIDTPGGGATFVIDIPDPDKIPQTNKV